MTPAVAVALIGFMGAGKSHAGMLAAALLRAPFVDTDALIAEQLGPIEEIFAQHGEAYFRSVERDVAMTVLEKQVRLSGVASLGGGAVMDGDVISPSNCVQPRCTARAWCLRWRFAWTCFLALPLPA